MLDILYWGTGYIGLVTFLIVLGFKLDNIILWHWMHVFIPGMIPSAIWIIYPIHSFFLACCCDRDTTYTELQQVMSHSNIVFALVLGFGLLGFGIPSASFIVLLVGWLEFNFVLSIFIIYIPVFVWLGILLLAWLYIYFRWNKSNTTCSLLSLLCSSLITQK